MPTWVPVWIDEGIWCVFPSRMRLRIATVATMISSAATRPFRSLVGSRICEITPWRASASCTRTCCCCAGGKASMMRSIVLGALFVWSVPKTRWPVSAAVSARLIVSRSRSSPTRMTSGSSRKAARKAAANDFV